VEKKQLGLVSNWLRHLSDVQDKYAADLKALKSDDARAHRLCELNILEQVRNVCEATVLQHAWKDKRSLAVHGWVYGLEDGLLRDLLKTPITSVAESLAL